MPDQAHTARVSDVLSRLQDTAERFVARLQGAGPRAEQATSGWTPAQIAVHVAMVNESLASVIDGSVNAAAPPPPDFREREWADVVRDVPARNEAPARFQPPAGVAAEQAVAQFEASIARLTRAIQSLTPERGGYCMTNKAVGTITLYQAGDFAIAHMIRHNQQMKRVLETGA
jgi:hypothetical protein